MSTLKKLALAIPTRMTQLHPRDSQATVSGYRQKIIESSRNAQDIQMHHHIVMYIIWVEVLKFDGDRASSKVEQVWFGQ